MDCVLCISQAVSEFVCCNTACGKLFHFGLTQQNMGFLTTMTLANLDTSFLEYVLCKLHCQLIMKYSNIFKAALVVNVLCKILYH